MNPKEEDDNESIVLDEDFEIPANSVEKNHVLLCEVEAHPANVTFHWSFNNTSNKITPNDLPKTKFTSEGTLSRMRHLPRTDEDYGTFGCWASNLVGHSKQPCFFLLPPPSEFYVLIKLSNNTSC